jgi:NTE family protein
LLRYTEPVTKEKISLALGGGAAKGLAHVGVLRGLEEDGVEVTAIAGTSMGAIVGALSARGMSAAEMVGFFNAVDWSRLGWIMARSPGGAAFRDLVQETIGPGRIEDLRLPYAAVCCDLATGDEVVLRDGPLAEAVRASSAIPGILPPVEAAGRNLVDGAMVTPVPVAAAASLSIEPVLAVNVLKLSAPVQHTRQAVGRLLGAATPDPILERVEGILGRHLKRLLDRKPQTPNRLDVIMRSTHVMQYNLSRQRESPVDTIEPDLGAIGWFDFHLAPQIIEEGYRAYRFFQDRDESL